MKVRIELDGRVFDVALEPHGDRWQAVVDGEPMPVRIDRSGPGVAVAVGTGDQMVHPLEDGVALVDGREVAYRVLALEGVAGAQGAATQDASRVRPPMTGRVESLLVAPGQTVARGDVLFVLEAMKMRNEVRAPSDGVVAAVHVQAGDAVDTGTVVVELEPAS